VGLIACLSAGCGSGKFAVEGRVVWPDGKPATELAGYTVEFDCHEARLSATSVVKPDASFDLYTDKPGDGVGPGTYKVALTQPATDGDTPLPPLLILKKYTSPETSGWVEKIDGRKSITLTVERAKRK
jgi:hypothetical protein